ncbi:MAG TPA: Rne/Rng family ribonuclease [Polyangiaceae bacterium]|jgi:ribonuclease G|nr:Rne/Rng family ribonuclease [Polyangiaceae bacterium]
MGRNTLVINCDIRENRVALIENGVIAELQIERAASRGTVGNVVLGRVTRVLPGMQAAFIDVGMERAAFLHVEDLIRPDDFETYLTGARQYESEEGWGKGEGGRRRQQVAAGAVAADDEDDDDDDEESAPSAAANSAPSHAVEAELDEADDDGEPEEAEQSHADEEEEEEEEVGGDEDLADDEEPETPRSTPKRSEAPAVAPQSASPPLDGQGAKAAWSDDAEAWPAGEEEGDDADSAPDEDAEEGAPAEGEPASALEPGAPARRRRRRRRRRGRDRDVRGDASQPNAAPRPEPSKPHSIRPEPPRPQKAPGRPEPRPRGGGARPELTRAPQHRVDARRGNNERNERNDRKGRKLPTRVSRSVPITEVVKEGDEVIVQVSKEPIGTKGARVTSHVSLPGRYVVYLPTVDHVGVSKRIGSARERSRLREVVDSLKPPSGGVIVRTVAEGLTKKSLKADLGYLYRVWEDVSRKRETAKAPTILYTELDLVLKTARDLFTDEIESIVIDDKEQYKRLVRFVEMSMPARVKDVHLYQGDEPIFDAYGIEDEISRALSRKVQLPSGGYLIIDQAEALTAIDVNTGRYVGKGSKDLEETALKTNLEAVEEIAYQLRFRNIGGLVILDLIDMDIPHNRDKVWRALEQRLAKDKAKTTINRISELGLIEMTRKRTRESLTRMMHETCFYCDGTGQIQSKTTIAYEILRQIRRERHNLAGYSVMVNAHPAIVDLMQGEERAAVVDAERRYQRRIELNPRREYHIEQFDLQGK